MTITAAGYACGLNILPAQMWRDDIRDVDIIDATQEGCSNDHQYEHESKKEASDICNHL